MDEIKHSTHKHSIHDIDLINKTKIDLQFIKHLKSKVMLGSLLNAKAITYTDPLGAFSYRSNQMYGTETNKEYNQQLENPNKRLFGYKPFLDDTSKSTTFTSTKINNGKYLNNKNENCDSEDLESDVYDSEESIESDDYDEQHSLTSFENKSSDINSLSDQNEYLQNDCLINRFEDSKIKSKKGINILAS